MTGRLPLPVRNVEYKLALRLLNQDPPLDQEIVEALVGRPLRYSELKPLLRGRNDNVLNKALHRLRFDGVIKQGLNIDRHETSYSLTNLGKIVLFRMHEMVPYHESIQAYEKGVKASS